jgi:iron complex outermembrane recepter protein
MRSIFAVVAVGLSTIGLAMADQAPGKIRISVAVPTESLESALQAYSRETGFHIVYISEDVRSRHSGEAAGKLTVDEALTRILGGTGLTYHFLDAHTISIVPVGRAAAGASGQPRGRPAAKPGSGRAGAAPSSAAFRVARVDGGGDPEGASSAMNATARGSDHKRAETLQTVVVTGSLVSRSNFDTPNPVQVISAKEMVQSGYTDISTVLRNISVNGASTLSQSFSFAGAAGGSGVSLRGLSVGDTLVLIDGERTIPYPLLDDTERSFVDLSSIPFMAVESVQVDKNGASAVYGSDAIAGVVNVILRKQFQGFTLSGETGTSQHGDATMEHFGFIGGHGDLAVDGYNWYVSGEFRHQDDVLASHRSGLWDTLDWTPYGGTYGGFANLGVGAADNPFFPYPATTTGYLVDPATGKVANYLPGCDAQSQSINRCAAIYPGSLLQPPTTRVDMIGKFTRKLGDDWTFGLQASWFESSSREIEGYNTGTGYPSGLFGFAFGPGMPFGVNPISQLTSPNIITVPTSNPMYPTSTCPMSGTGAYASGDPSWCGNPLALVYNFPEIGPITLDTDTNTYRLLANLDGTAGGWKMHATAGAMYARMAYKESGQLEPAALQAALNSGYVVGSSSGMSLFAPVMESTPWSELDLVDVHGQHKLFDLPGGPLELAIGAQYVKKVQDQHAASTAAAGEQLESGGPIYVIGTQKDAAAFVELDGKPVEPLEIDAAGRYDRYQGVGSAFTPQVGMKFTPWQWISLRGTWGEGFRAPSAAEGGQSGVAFTAGGYTDPVLCPAAIPNGTVAGPGDFPSQCGFSLQGFIAANPHLQSVRSTNSTIGFILRPLRDMSATVDYYDVRLTNDILTGFEAGGLAGGYGTVFRGAPLILPYCPTSETNGCSNSQLVSATTPSGTILVASYPYINAGSTRTSGFDLDLKYYYDAGSLGGFTGEATWTHLLTYQLTVAGQTYELAGTHGPSGISGDTGNPRDRGTLQVSWQRGALTLAPSLNFIGHFSITDPSSGIPSCGSALGYFGRFINGVTPQNSQYCSVKYFLETNLYAAYQLSGNLQVRASITNLLNKQPPVDVQTYGGGSNYYPYDPAMEQDGAVGRFFTIGATLDF